MRPCSVCTGLVVDAILFDEGLGAVEDFLDLRVAQRIDGEKVHERLS